MGVTERGIFLSTLPAGRGQRRLALAVVLVSSVIFLAAAPLAKQPLGQVWAFIPVYESALVINDLITAVLLFGQFNILRSRALLVLASGYLFTAVMTIAHALTFPGLFAPTGLLGAGPQSTAWLYMFWHGGFPLVVIAYALLGDDGRATHRFRGPAGLAVLGGTASVLALAGGFTLLATAGQDLLPAIMRGNQYTPAQITTITSTWVLSLVAVVMLWRRRPPSVLDLWLMVVMCAWVFDIALSGVLNAGRFDLGFYAGRIYGLLASSFVLLVLLLENGLLYARLVDVHRELDRHNRSLEQIVAERTQRLLQSEKVASMGSLLAGVAHELNNPLAILAGQAYLLHEGTQDSLMVTRTERILAASERCTRIVRNFLALARQQPPERTDVLLNQVVQGALELLAYELRTSNVEVTVALATDLPILSGDPHQLHQVLVNLLANAHHAMRDARSPRRITIATRADRQRNVVRLEVADTGPGIPTEIQARIFEPFFTTKPPGEGTGLGLSLCRGIIEDHGGTITIHSELGRGATFVIELPVVATLPSAGQAVQVQAHPPLGPKTILVADDEPDIAATLAEALEHDGHRVDIAPNGARALEMLQRKAYDLIMTDTKMPILDGVSFYRELERRFPAHCRRVIFVTGDVLDREKQAFLESTGVSCLLKPFDLTEVRSLVRRVLAATHP